MLFWLQFLSLFFAGGGKITATLPDGSQRRFDDLESHTKNIIRDKVRFEAFESFFAVLRICFPEDLPPKSEILDIYSRILINSFNLMNDSYQSVGIGLYLEASAFDHSCDPNAIPIFTGKSLSVRFIHDIETQVRLSDIRISYTHLLNETADRQRDLAEQYYFKCDCVICEDPDALEEGLKRGTILCPECNGPILLRSHYFQENGREEEEQERGSNVCCKNCFRKVDKNHISKFLQLKEEIKRKVINI